LSVHRAAYVFCKLLDWCDARELPFIFESKHALRAGFRAYLDELRDRVARHEISQNSAAKDQLFLVPLLSEVGSDDALVHGVDLLRIEKSAVVRTQPPTEEAQGRLLALASSIFEGLSELVLDNRPYPYAIEVPKSLGAKNNQLWVFPNRKWFMAPHEIARRDSLARGMWAFDFENGRINTVADICHRYSWDPAKTRREQPAETVISSAKRAIRAANDDRNHPCRRNAALSAHNAFIVLFLAHTGMNWSSVTSLPWGEGEPEIGVERQGFRTVKHRAMGETVSFEIQPIFLSSFRRFLKVRDYLLAGEPFERLFLASGASVRKVTPLARKTLTSIVESLRRIDPELTPIMSKGWRAGKSDWLVRNVDPSTAALVLQNSEYTVLQAYSEGSAATQADEMGDFFASLDGLVIARGAAVAGAVDAALGVCTSYGHPSPMRGSLIPADCTAMEGCLFCDKLRVHADERDVRKLLSCRLCVDKVAQYVDGDKKADASLTAIRERIDALLAVIEAREAGIVAKVTEEVSHGELDPYWASKIELLLDLELIS